MEVRKSAKIVIGVVGALGTIAALHFTIFASRANAYQNAKSNYETTVGQYRDAGRTPQAAEVNKFRYATLRKRLAFWQSVSNLNFALPRFYFELGTDFDALVVRHYTEIWNTMDKLQEKRKAAETGTGPKLTFLGATGWNLVDALPTELTSRNIAVEDELTTLRNEERLLKALDPQNPAYEQRRQRYENLLRRLGFDVTRRGQMKDFLGQVPSVMYTLNRIQQVRKNLPENYFRDMDEKQSTQLLYDLFRHEWPKDKAGNPIPMLVQRQCEALMRIVDIAAEKGVQEITYVKMFDTEELRWEEFKVEEALAATPTPDASSADMFMDEMMSSMDFEGRGGPSRFGAGGGAAATPEPVGELVGYTAPIEIWVTGPNSAISEFLYTLSNGQNAFEVDRLRIRTVRPAEGIVEARCFVNVIAFPNFIGGLNEALLEKKIVDLQRDLAELALRVGSRELAEADGTVVLRDGRPELAVPSPTPIPGMDTPTPAPPAAPEGQGF